MSMGVSKAVIMARGLGTRMRRPDPEATVDDLQERAARTGMKGMIPVGGRLFIDHLLSSLADVGYREACLVIGPEHGEIRDYYDCQHKPRRIGVSFAVQEKPLGTADAVVAAEAFTGQERFLAINSDNLYPMEALQELRCLEGCGLAGFERETLVQEGNLAPERVRQFPVLRIGESGDLVDIIEPAGTTLLENPAAEVYVSMNCWLLGPGIFRACRAIAPSPNGELELPVAIRYAVRSLREPFRVLKFRKGVLDLSTRGDISIVTRLLSGREAHL